MDAIHELIIQNKIAEALSLLIEANSSNRTILDDIILTFGRFTDLQRKETLGFLPANEINIEKNLIRQAILSFGGLTDKQIPKNKAKSILPEGLLGLGNEPGWSLMIGNESIIFVSDYGNKTHAYKITNSFAGKNIWHFRSNKPYSFDSVFISVTITKENWKDDMSGETYPFRVEVIEDFHHYIGIGTIRSTA